MYLEGGEPHGELVLHLKLDIAELGVVLGGLEDHLHHLAPVVGLHRVFLDGKLVEVEVIEGDLEVVVLNTVIGNRDLGQKI